MKELLILWYLLFISCSMHTSNEILIIDFQDFFDKDIVSCYIQDCKIFENLELTSDKSIGLTDISVIISEIKKGKIIAKYSNKLVNCSINSRKKAKITIDLNDKPYIFNIDFSKGKFIGIESNNGQISLTQSKYPFEYD